MSAEAKADTAHVPILDFLLRNPKFSSLLARILEWELQNMTNLPLGWEALEVGAPRKDVETLVYEGIVKVSMHSTHFLHFRLVDPPAAQKALVELKAYEKKAAEEERFVIPNDIFDDVVGHDEVKKLIMKALQGERVHFMFLGPPSSAKTLFLLCLERLPKTRYILGSRMSKAGLTDYLITHKPKILMLDEVDKMDAADYGVLLSLCETGRVTEMLYGRVRQVTLDTVVFGCANRIANIPPEVISRFEVLRFKDYTPVEFLDVVKNVLVRRGVDEIVAVHIAGKTMNVLGTRDPREAIRLSKLAKSEKEVDEVVSWLKKYR